MADTARRAHIYKQALSLLIAQRRPAYYLSAGRHELERLTNAYLRTLAAAGVIDRHETQPERRVFSAQFIEGATARLKPLLLLPPEPPASVARLPSLAA